MKWFWAFTKCRLEIGGVDMIDISDIFMVIIIINWKHNRWIVGLFDLIGGWLMVVGWRFDIRALIIDSRLVVRHKQSSGVEMWRKCQRGQFECNSSCDDDDDDEDQDVANCWSGVAQQIILRLVCSLPLTAGDVSTDRVENLNEFYRRSQHTSL